GTKLQLVETSLPPESNSASVKTIVYRGAVNAGRGVEQAIEAMQRLPNLRLLVAGDGDVLDDAKALVQKLNLGDQITFTGYASPSRLNELTTNAWLGLNLLDGTSMNYRFSLANKFFDFIQCGVPQITMRFPEYERVNNRYRIAMLIDDLRVDALVAAVNALVENEALYRELKLNCIEAAADLCWENERGTLLEFYRSLP
ncbi:MAG TPA: glycosyltransferase, partial [Chitinophagales bacterium]|nr:glycosyltransferase [Chitinophagales bacterium]